MQARAREEREAAQAEAARKAATRQRLIWTGGGLAGRRDRRGRRGARDRRRRRLVRSGCRGGGPPPPADHRSQGRGESRWREDDLVQVELRHRCAHHRAGEVPDESADERTAPSAVGLRRRLLGPRDAADRDARPRPRARADRDPVLGGSPGRAARRAQGALRRGPGPPAALRERDEHASADRRHRMGTRPALRTPHAGGDRRHPHLPRPVPRQGAGARPHKRRACPADRSVSYRGLRRCRRGRRA